MTTTAGPRSLADLERDFISGMRPNDEAKRLAPNLIEEAAECRRNAMSLTGAAAELSALTALRLERAAELLRILEQEQWRQREAAKLFLHGMIDRGSLRSISDAWNGDKTKATEESS